MLEGFYRLTDGSVGAIDTVEVLEGIRKHDGIEVWLDVAEPTPDELRIVGSTFDLDADALEDCLTGDQRPRIDEFEHYAFLVLYGAIGRETADEFNPRKLAVFCGDRFLITVHREPLRSVPALLKRCEKHPASTLGRGMDFILYSLIDAMVDNYILVAESYETRLEEIEERSLESDFDEHILARCTALRRELLEMRQLAVAQREVVTPLANGEFDHLAESLEQRFNHVRDHLVQATDLIDGLRERLHSIRDNYHTALATHTNAVMKTLTIFATILLPLSVVAGIYGMNVPLWPPTDRPWSFWAVLATMLVITLGLLYYFRRKRWL